MTEKKVFLPLSFMFFINFSAPAHALFNAHDFRSQTWAKGRSCSICHVIKNGMPSLIPSTARLTVDNAHLTSHETQAVALHPSNRLCFVCHQMDPNSTAEHMSPVDNLPVSPGGPPLPPSFGNGTVGSIHVRVNNQGAKGMDCLSCHDVHNSNTAHFMRADYNTPQLKR